MKFRGASFSTMKIWPVHSSWGPKTTNFFNSFVLDITTKTQKTLKNYTDAQGIDLGQTDLC